MDTATNHHRRHLDGHSNQPHLPRRMNSRQSVPGPLRRAQKFDDQIIELHYELVLTATSCHEHWLPEELLEKEFHTDD